MKKYSSNTFYLALFDNYSFISLGLDKIFLIEKHFKASFSFEVSPVPFINYGNVIYLLPRVNLLYGGKVSAELSFGYTWDCFTKRKYAENYYNYSIGLRYQKKQGGIFIKLYYTMLKNYSFTSFGELFIPGISIGYTIKRK